nr:3'-5' RNA helicase YTHDC2-like [Labrus bergylta]
MKLDDWLVFQCDREKLSLIFRVTNGPLFWSVFNGSGPLFWSVFNESGPLFWSVFNGSGPLFWSVFNESGPLFWSVFNESGPLFWSVFNESGPLFWSVFNESGPLFWSVFNGSGPLFWSVFNESGPLFWSVFNGSGPLFWSVFNESGPLFWSVFNESGPLFWSVFNESGSLLVHQAAGLVFDLRQKWQNLFLRRIRCPSKPWSQQDESIIRTLVSVLTAEEQGAGLQQPRDRTETRPMSSEEGPQISMRNSKSPQIPPQSTSDRLCRTPASSGRPQTRSSTNSSSVDTPSDSPASSGKASHSASPQLLLSSMRYFIMKSSNMRNIEISQQRGIWSTTPSNETKLSRAFIEHSIIILVFSAQGSGHFQGYARMTSAVSRESCQDWGLVGLGGVFSVDWIHRESLPFHCSQHIVNPWNDHKKVQISRDGQELEPHAGSQLLLLWDRNSSAQ